MCPMNIFTIFCFVDSFCKDWNIFLGSKRALSSSSWKLLFSMRVAVQHLEEKCQEIAEKLLMAEEAAVISQRVAKGCNFFAICTQIAGFTSIDCNFILQVDYIILQSRSASVVWIDLQWNIFFLLFDSPGLPGVCQTSGTFYFAWRSLVWLKGVPMVILDANKMPESNFKLLPIFEQAHTWNLQFSQKRLINDFSHMPLTPTYGVPLLVG